MTEHIDFLQSLTEAELCELVIFPLLEGLGFEELRYLHGPLELGKDIIGKKRDAIDGDIYSGFVVKSKKVSGSVSSNSSLREIHFQIKQAYTSSFIDPFKGQQIKLSKIYFITPFPISQNSILSIKDEISEMKDNIYFIDGVKLLDLINQYIPNLLSSIPSPEDRYLQILFTRFSKSPLISQLEPNSDLSVDDIYITAKLRKTTPEEAQYLTLGSAKVEEGQEFSEILLHHSNLVILADAGSGKSTLLHRLIVKLTSDKKKNLENIPIPLFIELSRAPAKSIVSLENFKGWILSYIHENFGYNEFSWETSFKFLLLLDAFDELKGNHDQIILFVGLLKRNFPYGIIITSRPSRIPLHLKDFLYFKLIPFSFIDIKYFLFKWYGDNSTKATKLYEFICSDTNLLNFCRTPLILTLFTILSSREHLSQLPRKKTEVYSQICDLLIDKWDSIRQISSEFRPDMKHFLLEKIAYLAHLKGASLTNKESIEIATQYFGLDVESAQRLFDELLFRSGLIKVSTSRLLNFEFVHLSFQEFFAAKHLFRFRDDSKILKVIFHQWWINTLKFYFGLLQSLDTLRLVERKHMGYSHILIEYLSETNFTSNKKRDEILISFAKQIIELDHLEKDILKIFLDNQLVLVPTIKELLIVKDKVKNKVDLQKNARFYKLIEHIGSNCLEHIDIDLIPIDIDRVPNLQDFICEYILDERARHQYIKLIELAASNIDLIPKYKLTLQLENTFRQKKNIKDSNLDNYLKGQLLKRLENLEDSIKFYC